MKRKILVGLFICLLIFPTLFISGCSSGAVNYYITCYPKKIVYQVGEELIFDGLKVETINSDGTHTMLHFSDKDISKVDTLTSGVKKVKIEKNGLSTAFNIYVADVIVNDSDDLKAIFSGVKDGDIVYLRAGNYKPKNNLDLRYKDILVNKSITIIGDGQNSTNFYGNLIIGANYDGTTYSPISDFKNVKILNIGFKLDYTINNNLINYDGPYGNNDVKGAINFYNTKNLMINGCSFEGYSIGINGENANGLIIQKCNFKKLFKHAIYISKDTENTSILENIVMDIGANYVVFDKEKQATISAIELSFGEQGIKGVQICKNTFNRIAFHNGDYVFSDEYSKEEFSQQTNGICKLGYMNNSSILTLKSSGEDDIDVSAIIISTNNFGQALMNIRLNTTSKNNIHQNGVLFIE